MVEDILEEFQGYYFEDLNTGMRDVFGRTITDADVVMFAGVSGDTNPVHLNDAYAEKTMFKSRIAHGMLTASLISTVVGTRLPGPGSIYVSQTLRFRAPVRVGDTVMARAQISKLIPDKNFVELETSCWVGETKVLDGLATVMVPSKNSQGHL